MKRFLTIYKKDCFRAENFNKELQRSKDENLHSFSEMWQSKHRQSSQSLSLILLPLHSATCRKTLVAELKAVHRGGGEMLSNPQSFWELLELELRSCKPSSDEKWRKGNLFFTLKGRNMTESLFTQRCRYLLFNKNQKPSQLTSCSCRNTLFLLFLTKARVCEACQCLLLGLSFKCTACTV